MVVGMVLYFIGLEFCLGCAWVASREDLVASIREKWAP